MYVVSQHTFCFVLFCFSDETEKMDTSQGSKMGGVTDFDEINVGSLVQILGKKLSYGIVRWVGCLPDCLEKIAGLELVCSLYTS